MKGKGSKMLRRGMIDGLHCLFCALVVRVHDFEFGSGSGSGSDIEIQTREIDTRGRRTWRVYYL